MKILNLLHNQERSLCRKQKERIYEVEMEAGRKRRFGLKDLEKMIDMLFEKEPQNARSQRSG